ncbi:MAG: HD-GYP domain-containing protein [Gammaproteobacteria bacterium]|nr:HD-GYP domain-containing protein [Gammaproteobacteria bacterium]
MNKKIGVTEAQIGMYVAELDRPWRDTPFLFQGFKITSDEELKQLAKHCKHIYIDTSQGADINPMHAAAGLYGEAPQQTEPESVEPVHLVAEESVKQALDEVHSRTAPAYRDMTTLDEEIQSAREVESKTRHMIYDIMEDVRLGRSINAEGAKQVVGEMTESIVRNPDAMICFSQLKNRDEYTALHSLRVCILALVFGRHLGLPKEGLNVLGIGALLHDVGKMKISTELINKPGKLSKEEFEEIKSHVPLGVEILDVARGIPRAAVDVARFHHERYDGTGYSGGRTGQEISLFGQIGGIVDCYDAITSDRSYHIGMSSHEALRRMYEWRNRNFDPGMIEQFIQCMGVYPIGSLVEMSTGSIGVVATINRTRRLRPKVVMVLTPDKRPFTPVKIVDLYHTPIDDESGHKLEISRVLPAGTHGINPTDYLPLH